MPDPDQQPATLAHLIAHEFGINAHCLDCRRVATVPARGLAERLGERFPVPALSDLLVCSRCGSRNVTVRIADAVPPFSAAWVARKV
jgi:hypothetical protein